jgi:hypothetical protein
MSSISFEVASQRLQKYLEKVEQRKIEKIQRKLHKNFSRGTVEDLVQRRPVFSLVGVRGRVGKTYTDRKGLKIIPVISADGKRRVLAKLDSEDGKQLMEKLEKIDKGTQIEIYGLLIDDNRTCVIPILGC